MLHNFVGSRNLRVKDKGYIFLIKHHLMLKLDQIMCSPSMISQHTTQIQDPRFPSLYSLYRIYLSLIILKCLINDVTFVKTKINYQNHLSSFTFEDDLDMSKYKYLIPK